MLTSLTQTSGQRGVILMCSEAGLSDLIRKPLASHKGQRRKSKMHWYRGDPCNFQKRLGKKPVSVQLPLFLLQCWTAKQQPRKRNSKVKPWPHWNQWEFYFWPQQDKTWPFAKFNWLPAFFEHINIARWTGISVWLRNLPLISWANQRL